MRAVDLYEGSWLLLFDGADSIDEIASLWPPGIHGDVIYTSRNLMLRRLPCSQISVVSELDNDEASNLLLKSAHLDTLSEGFQEQASIIVTSLGCLALAIDQAGAYLSSGECCIEDFLENFKLHH